MNNILEINNLYKNYQTKKEEISVLKDINLKIKKGDLVSLVGPSGVGKSTLLSIISGLEKPSFGNIKKKDDLVISYMLQVCISAFPLKKSVVHIRLRYYLQNRCYADREIHSSMQIRSVKIPELKTQRNAYYPFSDESQHQASKTVCIFQGNYGVSSGGLHILLWETDKKN